ncbi:MAG: LanC-like protein [Rubrivivax sp.]|nr:LanC-like protein [Rubrivivax sp.]MBK7261086.1 LanC-like protein [Rubrivivax sp.]MBK8529843.1 LanC-like protein [Rubrivivax sp.]
MRSSLSDLYDPARHEALMDAVWCDDAARAAITRICAAAEREFDETEGGWLLHPNDDPPVPGARSVNAYWGATGVVWALRDLALQGAVLPVRDYTSWIEALPDRARLEAADEQHGTASYLFGQGAPLLLAWQTTRRADFADRLHDLVRSNLHNPAHEPLWGNAGTLLAAIAMAEAADLPAAERARWQALVHDGVQALLDDMVREPDDGHWLWRQDLYGRVRHHLGAGHGLAGNAYPVLRAVGLVDPTVVDALLQRCLDTLSATALQAVTNGPEGGVPVANWQPVTERARIAAALAAGQRPLVQDCHGAPGIVCRLATAPASWDALLRAAGEMTWSAGPLVKGASLCHGTAGSAMACLKLWERFGEPIWLQRARQLAMHAARQVEQARARHGQGRHSLWTGDLGVACVLWSCVRGAGCFPTLDRC